MRKTEGVSRGWMVRALCKTNTEGGRPGFAWTVDRKDRGPRLQGRPARAWIDFAVTICQACPAQYDCARFAVTVDEKWNTWAMDIDDLKWLEKQPNPWAIIDAAEDVGLPMAETVVSLRIRMA